MNKSIILLSGGLDSLVTLGYAFSRTNYNVELAITFDYGQKTAEAEISASKKICDYYNIKHKVIKLDWLKEITNTTLVKTEKKQINNFGTKESAANVWVPNRNGLFLNIAASFCDSFGYNYILFGANLDESKNFPDNSEEFRTKINDVFITSTLQKPEVIAPLINYTKGDIVRIALEESIPLEFVRSCYYSTSTHCGECESCNHLKRALELNNCENYLNVLFRNN